MERQREAEPSVVGPGNPRESGHGAFEQVGWRVPDRLDELLQTRVQAGLFPDVVRQSGMMAGNAIRKKPTHQAKLSHRMLSTGRRVIHPAPNLRLMGTAATLETRAQVVLEGLAKLAQVMPQPSEVPPVRRSERGSEFTGKPGRPAQMRDEFIPLLARTALPCVCVKDP